MNIIFDARVIQDHFPGIGRYAYNLLAAMPANLQRHESIQALVDLGAVNTRYDIAALSAQGISLLEYPVPLFSARNLLRKPRLPAVEATQGNELLHFPYYMRPYRTAYPSITTVHDAILLVYPQLAPSAKARLAFRLLNALAIYTSRLVITVSECASKDLVRFFPFSHSKVAVIPEAADPMFRPQTVEIVQSIRRRYNLPEHFTLYLASNKPHKNLVRLMEAWAIVKRDWRLDTGYLQSPVSNPQSLPFLVIAGRQDPRYHEAQMRTRELGIADAVVFIGDMPDHDLPALYSACDLFVFPSLYEGFGLPPLEAMACGAPVVCSNMSSIPEVTGDAAILFDPLDPGAIATALRRVLENATLAQEMRERSLKQAARFSWDACARATMDVYRDIAKRPK